MRAVSTIDESRTAASFKTIDSRKENYYRNLKANKFSRANNGNLRYLITRKINLVIAC